MLRNSMIFSCKVSRFVKCRFAFRLDLSSLVHVQFINLIFLLLLITKDQTYPAQCQRIVDSIFSLLTSVYSDQLLHYRVFGVCVYSGQRWGSSTCNIATGTDRPDMCCWWCQCQCLDSLHKHFTAAF